MKTINTLDQTEDIEGIMQYNLHYQDYGKKITEFAICDQMRLTIGAALPHNYKAVDLGANNRTDIDAIEQICKKDGKTGLFEAVDPFSEREGVLKMSSQEYMQREENSGLDVIVAKYAIHFNKNQQLFFQNAHKRLKDNGLIFILANTKQCELPWTEPLQQTYIQSVFHEQEIPLDLFLVEKKTEVNKMEFKRNFFIEFVKRRSWSNLFHNTQQEIDQCIQYLQKKTEDTLTSHMVTTLFILRKKNKH